MSSPVDDHTTLFHRSWSLYDAITAENYMFHRELYGEVEAILERRHEAGGYSVLDLGCGNARFLAPCLRSAPPVSYTGVDLSPVALTEAQDYLAGLGGVSLHERDMVEFAAESGGGYDVIFSGYAMHHLDGDAKAELFSHCARALASGGFFLLIDVLREEGQNRDDYIAGYLGMMRTEWTAMSADDRGDLRSCRGARRTGESVRAERVRHSRRIDEGHAPRETSTASPHPFREVNAGLFQGFVPGLTGTP